MSLIYRLLASVYEKKGDWKKAINALEKTLGNKPESDTVAKVYVKLVLFYEKDGNMKKSQEYYGKAVDCLSGLYENERVNYEDVLEETIPENVRDYPESGQLSRLHLELLEKLKPFPSTVEIAKKRMNQEKPSRLNWPND